MKHWGVAVTEPLRESAAQQHLRLAGFESYLPLYWNGSRRVALFGPYIFVCINRFWKMVSRTRAVRHWLLATDAPSKLPRNFVRDLRSLENANGLIVLPRFEVGESVQINSGRFMGQIGLYEGMSFDQREIVLLKILGHDVHEKVNWSQLSFA